MIFLFFPVVSRFKGRILDTTILINPTLESLYHEIVDLLCTASPDCLIVYGGFVSEGEADWILQDGLFVFEHILHAISGEIAYYVSQIGPFLIDFIAKHPS